MSQGEIRYLCSRVVIAHGDDEFFDRLAELCAALKEHLGSDMQLIVADLKTCPTTESTAPESGASDTSLISFSKMKAA